MEIATMSHHRPRPFHTWLLGLLTALALAGCTMGSGEVTAPPGVALGTPFQLPAGKATVLSPDNLGITFIKVTEDSRCPSGMQCAWAGQAVIAVQVTPKGGSAQTVSVMLGAPPAAFDTYTVELSALDPAPAANGPVAPSDYIATLVVSKK